MEEDEGLRTRSFRYEDYNNRRAFLRSYPLQQWEGEDQSSDDGKDQARNASSVKGTFVTIIQWGEGKFVLLRRIKNKLAFYLVACYPFGFKSSKMITA